MKRLLLISAAICLFASAPAMADLLGDVIMRETGTNPNQNHTLYFRNFQPVTAQTGLYRWEYKIDQDWDYRELRPWGFCIEAQYSCTSFYTAEVHTLEQAPIDGGGTGDVPMGGVKADYLRELWADVDALTGIGPGLMTTTEAAAMQLAVWEIVYEDWDQDGDGNVDNADWDVLTNNAAAPFWSFKTSTNSAAAALANTWLGNVTGDGSTPGPSLVALTNSACQDYITIPAPAAIVLGMMGLGLAGWVRKRIK